MISTLKPRSNNSSVTSQVRFHGAKIAPGFHGLRPWVNGALLKREFGFAKFASSPTWRDWPVFCRRQNTVYGSTTGSARGEFINTDTGGIEPLKTHNSSSSHFFIRLHRRMTSAKSCFAKASQRFLRSSKSEGEPHWSLLAEGRSRGSIIAGITLFLIAGAVPSVWAQDAVQELAAQAIEAARSVTDNSIPAAGEQDSKSKPANEPQKKDKSDESRKTVKAQDCYTLENGEKKCAEYLLDAETGEPVEQWVAPAATEEQKKREDEGTSARESEIGRKDEGTSVSLGRTNEGAMDEGNSAQMQ